MNINSFKQIEIKDYIPFSTCIGNGYINSESSFATMYMWQHYANIKYTIYNNTIFSIYKNKDGSYSSFMPYGKNAKTNETLENLVELYSNLKNPLVLRLCTEDFVMFLKDLKGYSIEIEETRNSFDYIYNTSDLINLSGKKYHSKKNHINSFVKKYSYDYVKYNREMKNECLMFCKSILKQHYKDDVKSFDSEFFSIKKTFDLMDVMNTLKCAMITINDNIVALTVGEKLNNECALIHIEKADYSYRTAYSLINNLFLKNEFSDTVYVNREEDMGIEGLRSAKLSYNPCMMAKKYTVKIGWER